MVFIKNAFCIVLLCCIIACSKEKNNQLQIIQGMEKAVEAQATDEFIRPLIANYLQYYNAFKKDDLSPIFLYRCAVLYYRVRNFKQSAVNFERIILEYPNCAILEDCYLSLAMLYEIKLSNAKRTKELYTDYLVKYPQGKGFAKANYFFRPNKDKLQDYIDNILAEIAALPRGKNTSKAKYNTLLFAYINFIDQNPEDPLTAAYCLNASKIAVRLGRKLIGIQLLYQVYRDYENFYQYPDALLLLGVLFDDDISSYLQKKNIVSSRLDNYFDRKKLESIDAQKYARTIFRKIVEDYPDHPAAVSAKACLKNLGKRSAAQIVEAFLQKRDSLQN